MISSSLPASLALFLAVVDAQVRCVLLSRTLVLISSISLGCLRVVRNTCELLVVVITPGHKTDVEMEWLGDFKAIVQPKMMSSFNNVKWYQTSFHIVSKLNKFLCSVKHKKYTRTVLILSPAVLHTECVIWYGSFSFYSNSEALPLIQEVLWYNQLLSLESQ